MLRRHELVWLSERGWRSALATAAPGARAALARWRDADWPTIVRRADTDAPPNQVCLGVALPPDPRDGSKQRIALRAELADVSRVLTPLPLARACAAAPAHWRAALAALDADAGAAGIGLQVYGSLALQALTSATYLTPTSDIDLLVYPSSEAQLTRAIALFDTHAHQLPLDGEIVFPTGAAVAWKECRDALRAAPGARVLSKQIDRACLSPLAQLLASFALQACVA